MMSTTSEQALRGVITDSTVRASYEPSLTSSIASSRISVFSDSSSTQSSTASSYSDDFRYSQDDTTDHLSLLAYERQQQQAKALAEQKQYEYQIRARQLTLPSYASITSTVHEQKQHPRRSLQICDSRPPPLVRQSERKVNFVDNLVDSATQMVEVIWPLSVVPSVADARIGKGVLPLRTYIEETLRRSRTSYSTLQVALYYLILIKPFVPTCNFTMEQSSDCAATRALMCGRRMFLAALILASKYLQDRNYSAKAWSKMSGLGVSEINANEKTFLEKVDWQLHIPEMLFKRWTEIVLRYTPNVQFNINPSVPESSTWKLIVPLLTPTLDGLPCTNGHGLSGDASCSTGELDSSAQSYDFAVEKTPSYESLRSADTTPMPATIAPQLLQQRTDMLPPTPALLRMGPLPTPNMTPNSIASSTPAVSACGSRRSSLTSAMAFASRVGLNRCATDVHPAVFPGSQYPAIRGGSMYNEVSAFSSPESMLTDRSRNSRTSSVSSVSSSMALNRPCLARQATCRNAGLPVRIQEEKVSSLLKPIIFTEEMVTEEMDLSSSPEMIDFRVSEKVLHMPHRHSKQMVATVQHNATNAAEKTRKRCRPRGGRRSNLQEEVRILLEEDMESSMDLDHDESEPSPSPTDLPLAFTLAADMRSDRISRQDALVAVAHARVDSAEQHEANKRRCFGSSKLHLSALPQRTYLVS